MMQLHFSPVYWIFMQFPGVAMEAQSYLKVFKLACAGNFHNVNQKHSEYR